jgi:predicted nuclease with TOPRIM domain
VSGAFVNFARLRKFGPPVRSVQQKGGLVGMSTNEERRRESERFAQEVEALRAKLAAAKAEVEAGRNQIDQLGSDLKRLAEDLRRQRGKKI